MKEYIKIAKLIKSDEKFAMNALLKMYEKHLKGDIYNFNKSESNFLCSLASQLTVKGPLSEKQIRCVKNGMVKYAKYLVDIDIENKIGTESKKVTKDENNIIIKFHFLRGDARFAKTINLVRTLPGCRFLKTKPAWVCPVSVKSIKLLQSWEFDLDVELLNWFDKKINKPKIDANIDTPNLKKELFPFQREGVSFINNNEGRALIADQMGMGKTVQAIGYMSLYLKKRPVIIICPATLKLNWENEINAWLDNETIHIISGKNAYPLPHALVYIINYDILSGWKVTIMALRPEIIILDECHYVKSSTAKRTKAAIAICKKTRHIVALSGTPIVNRPIEFFNVIKIIKPGLFPSRFNYGKRFCNLRHNGFGWDYNGASNTSELYQILTDSIMIRRKKKDVLKDLSDKTPSIIPIEINNLKEYKEAESDIIAWIKKNESKEKAEKAKGAEVLVSLEKLKQLSIDGKIKQCISWIENFLTSDEKLIIFATHKKTINLLIERFKSISVKIDGSTPIVDRQKAVDRFQNNIKVKLFIGNIKAAGVGITLTESSNVCFLELPWSPGDVEQAEDRSHRIGQKNSVNIHYLIAQDTIEEDIMELIGQKQRVLNEILDGEDVDQDSIFTELIKKIKRK